MTNVTIIGTGNMGFPMAARLLKAGHDVAVYNRTRAKAGRHMHLDDFVAVLPKLKNQHIVITHVSRRIGIRKARHLLRREGYAVDDHWLTTREQTDAFKAEHGVKTTPQVFIDGQRIGGYDDLRKFFGKRVAEPGATSYRPVVALFAMTLLKS